MSDDRADSVEDVLVRLIEATASYCGEGCLERVRSSDAFIPQELVLARRAIEALSGASEVVRSGPTESNSTTSGGH